MKFKEIKDMAEIAQEIAMTGYHQGYRDCYNHTKSMSDDEKAVYMEGFKDE